MTISVDAGLRCSVQARTSGLLPAGTAAPSAALLLVEVPLPWPHDIGDHPSLAAVREVATTIGARIQGLVPSPASMTSGTYAVVLQRRPPGPFRRFARSEAAAPLHDLAAIAAELVAAEPGEDDAVDVLICTHGARDRCCGSLGMALLAEVESRVGRNVRRTSHLGGHRFAPTALVLPEGTTWAWLDGPMLDTILSRSGDVADVIDHYRGCVAMMTPAEQVAEQAVFAEVGWAWLDDARDVTATGHDGDQWSVRVTSGAGTWDVVVESSGIAPQPVCGEPLSAATKADAQLRAVELRRGG